MNSQHSTCPFPFGERFSQQPAMFKFCVYVFPPSFLLSLYIEHSVFLSAPFTPWFTFAFSLPMGAIELFALALAAYICLLILVSSLPMGATELFALALAASIRLLILASSLPMGATELFALALPACHMPVISRIFAPHIGLMVGTIEVTVDVKQRVRREGGQLIQHDEDLPPSLKTRVIMSRSSAP